MSKNTVRVYDTITKKYVEVEVNETVRTYYDRTQWNIEDNDKSFYKHEIQFSALKGNINGELENFKEFRTDDDSVEKCIMYCQPQIVQKLFSRMGSFELNRREITKRAVNARIIKPMNIIRELRS